jgi:serine/threonine protein phosphatase 1
MLYYAIGDIHGCSASLDAVLGQIAAHADTVHAGRAYQIILLGDYVDRGPDSAGVLDRAIALEAQGHIALPGNHERLMWEALKAKGAATDALALWRRNGGDAAMANYAIADFEQPDRSLISPLHRAFLERLFDGRSLYHLDRTDGLFFVHGGVRLDARLEDQDEEVLLWARPPRVGEGPEPSWVEGLHVVHGHTPRPEPDCGAFRTGLDTGAVYGGVLSAGVFVDGGLSEVLSAPGLEAGLVEARWR